MVAPAIVFPFLVSLLAMRCTRFCAWMIRSRNTRTKVAFLHGTMESAGQRVVWPPGMKNVVRRDVAYLRAALSPSMNVTSAFNAWYATCRILALV
jgi:hypothetical protein